MKGYRTYLALAVLVLNKILESLGFIQYSSQEVVNAIDIILAIIAFFFKYLSDKDTPKPQ